jgi:hypothetical protein
MVRHYHERIQHDLAADLRRPQPFLPNDLPQFVQPHLTIDNLTEQAFPIVRA